MYRLSNRSWDRMRSVNPRLIGVVARALQISDVDFTVLEGIRSADRQRQLVASGASQTMNSLHLIQPDGTAHAVDLGAWVDGEVSWHWPHYDKIAEAMKRAAAELKVTIEWGGDWRSFKDGPHFQLPR